MGFSRQEYWSGLPFPSPGDLPKPGIKSRSPALQVDSLPAEPQGKPKNIGPGSLSLLQGIFPNQGSNPGLLHCRWILYQLSYEGSPHLFYSCWNLTQHPKCYLFLEPFLNCLHSDWSSFPSEPPLRLFPSLTKLFHRMLYFCVCVCLCSRK